MNLKGRVWPSICPTYSPRSIYYGGNNINCVTNATYGAHGAITGFISALSTGFGGITNTTVYDVRLQPCRMSASSAGAAPTDCDNSFGNLLDLRYRYDLWIGDNGNVTQIINYRDQTRNQIFTYDALNRLSSAQNFGTDCSVPVLNGKTKFWGNTYTYDAWGNLLVKHPTKCSAENLSGTVRANNRLQDPYIYDAAGNMTHDATANLDYVYDPENRIMGAGGFTYIYDADGNRVEKTNGATGTIYWYMSLGVVGESDLAGNLNSEYIFFDGKRVARKDFPGKVVSYYFSDHLKTATVITDASGTIQDESDYYPWGGELQFVNNLDNHYKFTGKERDSESGLDYFGARYYSNGLGRFISADWSSTPIAVPYADFDDPQSLNQYSYVRNIPTVKVDLDGHGCPPVCDVHVDMELVKQTLNQMKPLAPLAPSAVGAAPILLLAAPSVGAMTFVASQPPMQNHPGDDTLSPSNMILDALNPSFTPAPPVDQGQKQQSQQQQQGQTQEQKTEPEPQTATGGAGQGAGKGGPGKNGLPGDVTKLKGNQGYRDKAGNTWKKDMLHKNHWDISNKKGDKIKEVDFDGKEIWPNGPKNKNK